MKAVIPCAKKEDDLWPFIESKPTGLLPVAGKPLVKHLIKDLQEAGVDDIYLVTNYREDDFVEIFDGYTNVNTVTQEELRGTGDAVSQCDFIEEDFVVVNGDVIVSQKDIQNLIDKHREKESKATVLATEDDRPEKFGVLSIQSDKVVGIEEKPDEPENVLVNTGVYVLSHEIFEHLNSDREGSITDAVEELCEEDSVRFRLAEDYWMDIGSLKTLHKADSVKRTELVDSTEIDENAEVHESVEISGNAVVEKDAELKPGTVLEGEVFIGGGSVVGPNTVVRDTTVNKRSQVRNAAVDDSLLFERCIIDPETSVEKSVIGEESDIKSGTIIRESFIGPRSFVEMNNSIYGVKFVPDARTDLGEISK